MGYLQKWGIKKRTHPQADTTESISWFANLRDLSMNFQMRAMDEIDTMIICKKMPIMSFFDRVSGNAVFQVIQHLTE